MPLLLLAGCTGVAPIGPVVSDEGSSLPGGGEAPTNEILITRAAETAIITQRLTQPVLFLEAREIGRCRADEPVLIQVPDGTWAITALTPGGEVTRDVTLGGFQKVALECGVTGNRNPAPILEPSEG